MDINSLPSVSQSDMQAMMKNAEKMSAEQGLVIPHPDIQKEAQMVIQPELPRTGTSAQPNWQLQAPVAPEEDPLQAQSPAEINGFSAQPDIQEISEEDSEITSQEKQSPPSMAQRKTPAQSFSELKAKAEKAERERDELLRKLYEREISSTGAKQQQQKIEQAEEDLDFKLADDDLADGKTVNKVDKKVKRLEQQLLQYQQQAALATTEARIKSQYSDFDKVVSKDNLDLLSYTYPELATTLNSTQDLYSKAVSAYMMIRNMGIYKEEVNSVEKKRIAENAQKPRLSPQIAAQSGSALSKANMFADGLTPELQEHLRREMNMARKDY
ncbi:MAG TPA: hypothetical protein VHA52_02360 [Candidatus Babeliaceae bacterium]|nr:hypothetical protein [Candidatus Babeliaceae bacterium]